METMNETPSVAKLKTATTFWPISKACEPSGTKTGMAMLATMRESARKATWIAIPVSEFNGYRGLCKQPQYASILLPKKFDTGNYNLPMCVYSRDKTHHMHR